jgi:glutathione S-transferase|tara:strand:- start:3459 stop:4076 length:618 start_codon:yes stop_codon:yes gene_type:complete
MKLFNSMGPNPHIVRMYAAELGVTFDEVEEIDLMAGDNRKPEYLQHNPAGQLPAVVLDNGAIISEITAICEYLDETTDGQTLMGNTAAERAHTRMWTRRVDLGICEPMVNGFRYAEGMAIFKDRMVTVPEGADGLKSVAQSKLAWLDEQMADGREFVAGSAVSLADVLLFGMLAFAANVGQPLNADHKRVGAWFERMAARPSAAA